MRDGIKMKRKRAEDKLMWVGGKVNHVEDEENLLMSLLLIYRRI